MRSMISGFHAPRDRAEALHLVYLCLLDALDDHASLGKGEDSVELDWLADGEADSPPNLVLVAMDGRQYVAYKEAIRTGTLRRPDDGDDFATEEDE